VRTIEGDVSDIRICIVEQDGGGSEPVDDAARSLPCGSDCSGSLSPSAKENATGRSMIG
jgi:hypothetical protein